MKSNDLFAFMKRENNFSHKRKQYILMSNEES